MSLLDEMAKFFSPTASASTNSSQMPTATAVTYPIMNLSEDDDYVYAEALLPGQKLSDLDITVTVVGDESKLTIQGERKELKLDGAEWHCRERGFGGFHRVIDLPEPMEPSEADAVLENGVLTIKMAKSSEAKAKTIPVKAD